MMRKGIMNEKDLPLDKFEILISGKCLAGATIRIYEVTGEASEKLATEEEASSDQKMITYNEYTLEVKNQENLSSYIKNHYDWFLEEAKSEYEHKIEKEAAVEAQEALDKSDYKVIKEAERFLKSVGIIVQGRESADKLRTTISEFRNKYN